jgi:O-antigen/teichoic acid export membrane protein
MFGNGNNYEVGESMNFKKAILKFLLYFVVFTVSNLVLKTILIPNDLTIHDIISTILTTTSISIGIVWVEYSLKKNKKTY